MECSACGHSNRDGANFCSKCGGSLAPVCPSCGADVEADANFCDVCGASLSVATEVDASPAVVAPFAVPSAAPTAVAQPPLPTPPVVAPPAAQSADRRQLTVVFCDLVGSTEMSGRLDPEALRDIIRAYQTAAEKVILRYEGHVAQYLGDGLLAYFGFPRAHEDDVHRAVSASLGILGAVSLLAPEVKDRWGADLEVRIGAHTGHVVVGEMGGAEVRESLAVGDTPNIAARVQGIAEPGALVITDASHRIVDGFFNCSSLGEHDLRGVSKPMQLHRVLHESTARTRLDVAATIGLTPLVGRDREVAVLAERWEDAKRGSGGVVTLRGEGGIGKSRLVASLKEHVALDSDAWLSESQCSAHHRNTALHPVIDTFENTVLRFTPEDTDDAKRERLAGLLAQYGFDLDEAVPLFSELFSIPPEPGAPDLELTPEQRRQRVLEGFARMLCLRGGQQPTLFVMEDLQWADPSTLELMDLVVDQAPGVSLLVLLTSRPEFESPWGQRSFVTQVNLSRLRPEDTADMVLRVAGGKSLPEEVVLQVVEKTDGVPLFVEELLKTVIDSDLLVEREHGYELTRSLPALGIPSTLHASLMARLDRLAAVRDVLQLAATVGREFSYQLLRAVSPLDEATLREHLAELVGAEFLYPKGAPPTATYTFKHALVQDAAYGSLLQSTQQIYHQKIAAALESRGPDATPPELLAHHYTAGGRPGEAIAYWHKAGRRAKSRAATAEAISHLRRALDLIGTLPPSEEAESRELDCLIELGPALIAADGYGSPEVKSNYTRALDISGALGEDSIEYFRALSGLWAYYMSRGPLATAHDIASRLLSMAERSGDVDLRISARSMLADAVYNLGDFHAAVEHGEAGIALDRGRAARGEGYEFSDDAGLMCRVWMSWALSRTGHQGRATEIADEALRLGLAHPSFMIRVEAPMYAAAFYGQNRMFDVAHDINEQARALATEFDFPVGIALADMRLGWLRACQGDADGVRQIQQGVDAWRALGSAVAAPAFMGLLAEGCIGADHREAGLDAAAEGLRLSDETGTAHNDAELRRMRGDLLMLGEPSSATRGEAEAAFWSAIETAREQHARASEMRAALSLCRLWREDGRIDEARALLAEVYEWFEDGSATPDLRDASALLEALAESG
jgi:class 3 adenylate cyclase/tetratricopeptide (TPR) repeat protein